MNDVGHERLPVSLKEDSKMTEFGKTLYELNLRLREKGIKDN
jgi:hypothetical protein